MEEQIIYGFEFKQINNLIKRSLNGLSSDDACDGVTGVQGMIIGFLYREAPQRDIFQRDIEREFRIRRSTATGILRLMEQNGLIIRDTVDHDARLKKLSLTPKAAELHEGFHQKVLSVEKRIVEGFTEEERKTLLSMLERVKTNLESE